jgi:hypothetical protein
MRFPVETRLAASPAAEERWRYEGDLYAELAEYFGRIDHSASYSFWYSDHLETVESASATASANSYNEKSLKPHLKQ